MCATRCRASHRASHWSVAPNRVFFVHSVLLFVKWGIPRKMPQVCGQSVLSLPRPHQLPFRYGSAHLQACRNSVWVLELTSKSSLRERTCCANSVLGASHSSLHDVLSFTTFCTKLASRHRTYSRTGVPTSSYVRTTPSFRGFSNSSADIPEVPCLLLGAAREHTGLLRRWKTSVSCLLAHQQSATAHLTLSITGRRATPGAHEGRAGSLRRGISLC